MTWYIVTGREYGDDEDAVLVHECASKEEAFNEMRFTLAQHSEDFADWVEQSGYEPEEWDRDLSLIEEYEEENGRTFYVLWIIRCPGGFRPEVEHDPYS